MSKLPEKGKIIVRWDKNENDILYNWGDEIPKCDINLIHGALTYNYLKETDIMNGLLNELERRGYDLNSFRMEIKKNV